MGRTRDVLAGADETLTALDAALLDGHPAGLLDSLDGALDGASTPDDATYWTHSAMRWAPPPGPGEVDPFARPDATDKFLSRVRNPAHRPTDEPSPPRVWVLSVHTSPGRVMPPFVRPATPDLLGPLATLTPGDANMPARRMSALTAAVRGFSVAVTPLARAMKQVGKALAPLADLVAPSKVPEDARDRALYLRQTRNTGPDHGSFPHRGGFTHERVPGPRGRGRSGYRAPRQRR